MPRRPGRARGDGHPATLIVYINESYSLAVPAQLAPPGKPRPALSQTYFRRRPASPNPRLSMRPQALLPRA